MNVDDWLTAAIEDAERRGLSDLRPLLETLARATRVLRAADWNDGPTVLPSASGRGAPGT